MTEGIEGPFLPGGRQKILWQEVAGLQLEDLGHDPVIAFYLAEPDRVKRSRRARRQIRQSQAQGQGGLRMDTKKRAYPCPRSTPRCWPSTSGMAAGWKAAPQGPHLLPKGLLHEKPQKKKAKKIRPD